MNKTGNMKILFLSTYPPRACGIATFTQDLATELVKTGKARIGIAAMNDSNYAYPTEVEYTIWQQNRSAYSLAAEKINHSGADLLMIEHEYGIFGGDCGEYLLGLTKKLTIPFLVTLHTVLPHPNQKQRNILTALSEQSDGVITMAQNSMQTLMDVYDVDPRKISVIHHGVPSLPVESRSVLKKKEGLQNRFIVSTFGLLSPGKGLEYGIQAIAKIVKKHPEVCYLILGQTHPVIKMRDGEKYRESLEAEVRRLNLADNVRFVNKYLSKEEIIRYLQLSDVYMTPYLGKDQAVSGTLAYATGYGRVIVSTPYPYARQMLADGRGFLAEFQNADSLVECITRVLEYPDMKAKMEAATLRLGKNMMWNRVAENYLALFRSIVEEKTEGESA